jgi:steroid delta-isomerase-like uncharacterized protein
MSTIHRFRPAVSAFITVLTFAFSAPFAVNAEDEVVVSLAKEQVLTAAPAAPSWDDTSGYGSVEASRAEVSALLSGELISGRDQALAFAAAAAMLWDETSGYGSVEASRAAASALFAPVIGPSWDDTSGYGSVEASRAIMPASLQMSVTTQPATPAASPVAVPALFQAWLNAYIDEDPDAFAALYTSDGIYEDVPSGQAVQGREAIAALAADFMLYQDNYAFAPSAFFQGDDWAVLEVNSSATDAETGQPIFGVRIATVFELDDGQIRRSSDYYDVAGILAQLGLLPEEGTPLPGTPTS